MQSLPMICKYYAHFPKQSCDVHFYTSAGQLGCPKIVLDHVGVYIYHRKTRLTRRLQTEPSLYVDIHRLAP